MVRRGNLPVKNLSRRNHGTFQPVSSSTISTTKQTPSENLDEETKLAKRHLTKEMWQLVSIAVKRMADELVSISNNQHSQEPQIINLSNKQQPTSLETIGQSLTTNTGAGDIPYPHAKSIGLQETIPRRSVPIQMLESSLNMKKKGMSNNATHRTMKSKAQKKSWKKPRKPTITRLRNNYKSK